MHALHLIINHRIYVFWIITGGDLNTFQQNWRQRKNHWVDSRTTRREDNNFQTLPSGRATSSNRQKGIARRDLIISASNKRNHQMGFQVVLDRQRGSCISILVKEGRQKGPRISLWIKGIARWDSKLMEIARRDLVFRYLEVARWDLVLPVEKKRESPDGIPSWLKEIARRDLVFRYLEVARWDLVFQWIKGIAGWDSKLI